MGDLICRIRLCKHFRVIRDNDPLGNFRRNLISLGKYNVS